MNAKKTYFQLADISVVDVTGVDRATIVHNLTTNEVKSLELNEGRESFVTDVRGKTLGHVCVFNEHDRLRMIGPGPSEHSAVLIGHLDRYTILEDATPAVRDDDYTAFLLPENSATELGLEVGRGTRLLRTEFQFAEKLADAYGANWLGEGTAILLVAKADAEAVAAQLQSKGIERCDEDEFHRQRIRVGFPWYGQDMNDTNLPQEADRDALAVSFTKGCYLGQETVARLDALGQVQKKLVRWSIADAVPAVDTALDCDGKKVGRLTSVAAVEEGAIAIGFARRSHFESGATAMGSTESGNQSFTATVLE
ncbi:MAG: folate-binding protein YgfZ [Rubripirellula sp.]